MIPVQGKPGLSHSGFSIGINVFVPLGRLIQIYAYICAFGERAAPGIMTSKVRRPEGYITCVTCVILHDTFFSIARSTSSREAAPSWKNSAAVT